MGILESLGLVKATPWIATTAGKATVAGAAIVTGVVAHRVYTREQIISDCERVRKANEERRQKLEALMKNRDEIYDEMSRVDKELKAEKRKARRAVNAIRHDVRDQLSKGGIGIFRRKGDPDKVLAGLTGAKAKAKAK
jgi:ribulose kinase